MVAKIYPYDSIKQIERSRRRIEELEIAIADIRLQKGWVNWWLSFVPDIVYNMRAEIQLEKNKIKNAIDNFSQREYDI